MTTSADEAGAPPVPALFFAKVERRYAQGTGALDILRGADLAIWPGELVALVAPSGAGKSTLLHLAGLLERPDGGEVYIGGQPTAAMPDAERTRFRREEMGFIYQFHHLLPEFSALENVVMPQLIRGLGAKEAKARATETSELPRLEGAPCSPPGRIIGRRAAARRHRSRGRQRPAAAVADEPTGNLDPHTAAHVFGILVSLVRASGLAALVATHNMESPPAWTGASPSAMA